MTLNQLMAFCQSVKTVEKNCRELESNIEVHHTWGLDSFISWNKQIFEGLGTFSYVARIKLVNRAIPIANPPRSVPLAIRPRLEQTLRQLTNK
ncbi:Hypothetical protein CINCED_3A010883 [Cinara cedri]|uniref:Uncharacterized protein n=1 Tax=Cinara cedri TaxID=506608 RepID=A0A5E4M2I3_9HEMI|nr:Hypothetical protein CINCED_3A010883 [Cinara cedri]